jgi:hypothetical protein
MAVTPVPGGRGYVLGYLGTREFPGFVEVEGPSTQARNSVD